MPWHRRPDPSQAVFIFHLPITCKPLRAPGGTQCGVGNIKQQGLGHCRIDDHFTMCSEMCWRMNRTTSTSSSMICGSRKENVRRFASPLTFFHGMEHVPVDQEGHPPPTAWQRARRCVPSLPLHVQSEHRQVSSVISKLFTMRCCSCTCVQQHRSKSGPGNC